jgi:hypothetical protein
VLFAFDLFLSRTSVSVQNYWRSFSFDWNDVKYVSEALQMSGVVPQKVIAFVLKDGRVVRVQATGVKEAKRRMLFDQIEEVAPRNIEIDRRWTH